MKDANINVGMKRRVLINMKQFIIIFLLIFAQTSLLNSACHDVDNNSRELKDAIITLQALTDKESTVVSQQSDISDINNDNKIGLPESIHILKLIAGIQSSSFLHCATLYGTEIYAFNGLPVYDGWGEDLVYPVNSFTADTRSMGPLGGIPLVDIWNENGGVAIFNTSTYQEPFTIRLKYFRDHVMIEAEGASNIEIFHHNGDYYEAMREFALRMKAKGLFVQSAPDWAFDPIWETYGFEEDWNVSSVMSMLPLLKEIGIKTITLDSGWYGSGTTDWNAYTGDFPINPNVIGTEQSFVDFIDVLHQEGFRVKLWWVPGVAEKETSLHNNHPDWFYAEVVSPTGDTADWYLDPTKSEVINWNYHLIQRLLSYGVDGFKQDDIYHIITDDPAYQKAYASFINRNYEITTASKSDFVINTCNCGLAQNFYHMPGQNQIITSDPVGSKQFRHRAKYLHALNVGGAAILADHVELTKGDVGLEELDEPGFYNSVDFASLVPLGMVYETKFRSDPGILYRKWLDIYNTYQFFKMEWVNIPIIPGKLETYLMRDGNVLYFSFFTPTDDEHFNGKVILSHLSLGKAYIVYDIVNEKDLGAFTPTSDVYALNVDFTNSLVIQVK
jgi:hypothetical protein